MFIRKFNCFCYLTKHNIEIDAYVLRQLNGLQMPENVFPKISLLSLRTFANKKDLVQVPLCIVNDYDNNILCCIVYQNLFT